MSTGNPRWIQIAVTVFVVLLLGIFYISTSFNESANIRTDYSNGLEFQIPPKISTKPLRKLSKIHKHGKHRATKKKARVESETNVNYHVPLNDYNEASEFEPGESWFGDEGLESESDYSSWDYWQDMIDQVKTMDINEGNLSCPERRPVVITEKGERQIPQPLYNMAKQVFDSVPPQFLQNERNPCWKERSKINCLPSFFLAGFPKSGTTDLWGKIQGHPDVLFSRKEPHWWTRTRLGKRGLTLQDYSQKYYSHKSDSTCTKIIGDGSASTAWDNIRLRQFYNETACKDEGPPYVVPDIIRTVIPKSKIIMIMRNPTERLYSAYMFFAFGNRKMKQKNPSTFHIDVMRAVEEFNACLKQASYRMCAYDRKQHDTLRLYIGLYSIFVRDWLNVFPRDQFMFLRLEDWNESCNTILPRIFKFLKLAPLQKPTILSICERKKRNPTKRHRDPMLNKTRQILDEFYSKTQLELADILDDERFLWN